MTKETDTLSLDEYEAQLSKEIPGFADALAVERDARELCTRLRGNLRRLRKELGVRQAEVAAILQMSQSAVSRFEKGEGDIGLMTLCRYATSLGLQPAITFVPAASSYQNAEKLRDVAHAIEQLYAAAPTALNRPDTEQGVEVVTRRRKKGAKQEGMPVDFADWASAANATMLRNVSAEFAQILSNMPAFRSDKDSES